MTIESASRFAWSLSSCAARSAETSVVLQQRLELAVARELALEQLDAVRVVGPLAPDGLEADDDVVEQAVDLAPAVAEEAASELDVADLDRCV